MCFIPVRTRLADQTDARFVSHCACLAESGWSRCSLHVHYQRQQGGGRGIKRDGQTFRVHVI